VFTDYGVMWSFFFSLLAYGVACCFGVIRVCFCLGLFSWFDSLRSAGFVHRRRLFLWISKWAREIGALRRCSSSSSSDSSTRDA
jgi:hypothetical protein